MKFTPHSEKILKDFFTTQKKEKLIGDLDSSISNMENDLLNFLKSDYSQLIDECSWLEEIKEKIADIRLVNLDVNKIANGLNTSFNQNQQEEKELDRCKIKIELCQRELKNIEKFLDLLLDVKTGIEDLENFQIESHSTSDFIPAEIKEEVSSNPDVKQKSLQDSETQNQEHLSSNSSGSLKDNNLDSNKLVSNSDTSNNDKNHSGESEVSKILEDSLQENIKTNSDSNTKVNSDNQNLADKNLEISNGSNNIELRENSFSNRSKNSLSKIIEDHSSSSSQTNFAKIRQNNILYYKITKKLANMRHLIESISKFFFYNSFKKSFEEVNDKFKSILFSNIEELLLLDWCSIGHSIKLSKNISLFDEINSFEFLPKKHRISIFCIQEIGLENKAVDFIDKVRKSNFNKIRNNKWALINPELGDKNNSKVLENLDQGRNPGDLLALFDDLLNFCSGTIVLSYILSTKLPAIYTFYNEILEDLPKITIFSATSLSRLRLLVKKLNINSYSFDSIIENLVFNYINSLFKHPDILKYDKDKIFRNIQDCIDFINEINMFKGEFDELFIRKLDNSFIFLLNNSPIDSFFARVEEMNEFQSILGNNEIFKNCRFDYLDEIGRSMEKLAEKEVEEISIFSTKNTTEEVVKRLIRINHIPSQDFKNKFVSIFEQKISKIYSNRSKEDQVLILDTAKRNLLK